MELNVKTPLVERWIQHLDQTGKHTHCGECKERAIARSLHYAERLQEQIADLQKYGQPMRRAERFYCLACLRRVVHARCANLADQGDTALDTMLADKTQSLVFVRFYGAPGELSIVLSLVGSLPELMASFAAL